MKNHLAISLAAGAVLSAAALYFAFRNVPVVQLLRYLASINYLWVLPATVTVIVSFALRAYRWRVILESARKITFWQAFHPLMIGFMVNCIMPGRIGEIARPAILQKKEKIAFTTGFATVAAERVFDICLLVMAFTIIMATIQINPQLQISVGKYQLSRATLETVFKGMVEVGFVLIVGIVMVSIARTRRIINRIIMTVPGLFFFAGPALKTKLEARFCRPLVGIVENIARGFELIKYPKRMLVCVVLTMFIWCLQAFSYYLVALGSPGLELTFGQIFAVMIVVCFFIALPSVPGFWGLWEAGGVFALALFGVGQKAAAGYTLANHAIQMFPVILIGLVSAAITSISLSQLSGMAKKSDRVKN